MATSTKTQKMGLFGVRKGVISSLCVYVDVREKVYV